MSRITFQFATLVTALLIPAFAEAGAVQFQLGEQDFVDGKTPIFTREIREAGAGEVYPFNGAIFGHDMKRELGAFDFSHAFDLGSAEAVSAKLTIGLIDIDSPKEQPFDTVSIFFNGVSQPTDFLRGVSEPGSPSSVEVVDIPVPIDLLAGGVLHVTVAAKMPGYANLGNAIEADFSRLVVELAQRDAGPTPGPFPTPTPPPFDGGNEGPQPMPGPQPVPLPPVLLPAGMILAGLAALPRRRLQRWLRV